jgi:hypothetical protein
MTIAIHSWKKSSYSGQQTDCVEVAYAGLVRDSKQSDGPRLSVPCLAAFIDQIKAGRLHY